MRIYFIIYTVIIALSIPVLYLFRSIRKYTTIYFFSILLSVLVIPLRGGYVSIASITGFPLSAIVGFILYALLTVYFLKKFKGESIGYILLCILLGCLILSIPIRLMDFEGTLISLLEEIIHILGVLSGYLIYKLPTVRSRILACILLLSACFWLSIPGYEMWSHKLNFRTFTGTVANDHAEYNLTFQTNTGDTLSLSDFKGKYLLLDCWCGICYSKMPEMQKLYDAYKENDRVIVCALHSYMEKEENEDYSTGSKILKERDYTYPCWAINIDDPALKELGVNVYPTVLIFDTQSKLIFRGRIENAKKMIDSYLKR